MDKKTRENYYILIVFILFIISFALRLYRYGNQTVQPDEIFYSSWAFAILSQNWEWGINFMLGQPPLFPYLLAVITFLFGGDMNVLRVVPIIFGSLSVFPMYYLGKTLFDRRVGLLSAILLCFCSFHILYSRTLMLEAPVIFFILTSMYFFWKSYNDNRIIYACLAGIFLGLACDTKYIGFGLYPAYILYLLWINKKWKCLLDKRALIIFTTSFFVFLPVLINLYQKGINPFYWQLFERFEVQYIGYKSFGFIELLIRGFNNYTDLMIDGHSVATTSLPWFPAVWLAAAFIFPLTILYSFYHLLKGKSSMSFIMISYLVFNCFVAIYKLRFQYYLLWALPTFFIMFSCMSINFLDYFRFNYTKKFSFPDFTKVLVLILACIFVFSNILTGVMAPAVNKPYNIGFEELMEKLEIQLQPGDIIAVSRPDMVNYYVNKYGFNEKELNIYVFSLYMYGQKQHVVDIKVNMKLLDKTKPRYMITSVPYYLSYVSINDREMIQRDYNLVSNLNGYLLFERKSKA